MKKKLREFCLNILAHAHLDAEITLNGNGTNACEAYNVARALMKMFKIEIDEKEVEDAATELEKMWYGPTGEYTV
jgi:DNA-binding protein